MSTDDTTDPQAAPAAVGPRLDGGVRRLEPERVDPALQEVARELAEIQRRERGWSCAKGLHLPGGRRCDWCSWGC